MKIDLKPTEPESGLRDAVMNRVLAAIGRDEIIHLPAFDPKLDSGGQVALHSVGIEPNDFGGTIGEFRYQFEGEEDLLHLIVVRLDGKELTPEEGQSVATFLFPSLPAGLIWLKPGRFTQHFYLGHDELVQ